MSEFELSLIRKRLVDAAVAKAKRGELRIGVPVGYLWSRDDGLMMDPDRRIQDAVRTVFRLFDRLGSATQVLLHMRREGLLFPGPADGKSTAELDWRPPVYRNVISVLQPPPSTQAPTHTGRHACRPSSSTVRCERSTGEGDRWTSGRYARAITTKRSSPGKRSSETELAFRETPSLSLQATPSLLAAVKALLAGLLRCRRCGRMLSVAYTGHYGKPRYACRRGRQMHGVEPCISFGAARPDQLIGAEILLVVEPLAVAAAFMAERDAITQIDEHRRALELERQQAEYDVKLARRRHERVDPDNRLVAAELEARWNATMTRLKECETRLLAGSASRPTTVDREALLSLSSDLEVVWRSSSSEMLTKQRLVRALIEEIVVDVDDEKRELVLVVHWRGGQHSEVRVRKPQPGEHAMKNPVEVDNVIRQMGARWS